MRAILLQKDDYGLQKDCGHVPGPDHTSPVCMQQRQ